MPEPLFRYLYLDMNSYFASVEQQDEPALRGRPVGIVTVDRPGAACIAASYEAKCKGIGVGTRTEEAKALCPGIVFRPARHDRYVDVHHAIREAVERVHPVHGTHSVDEFSCRLGGRDRPLSAATALAEAIRDSVTNRVGVAMRCSIGLGPSRLLAKTAGEMHKPAGFDWLSPEVLPEKLAAFSLRDLPGIGKNMERRLIEAGIRDIRGLWAMQPKHARRVWNGVDGERFLRALHGEDIPDPATGTHSLGHSQILSGPNRNAEGARLVTRRLLIKAATRVRRGGGFEARASGEVSPREALCAKIDALNQRYGQDTVIFGERPVEIAPYTGAKIAFGRIPTVEEFRD